jgi:hypothetical protein
MNRLLADLRCRRVRRPGRFSLPTGRSTSPHRPIHPRSPYPRAPARRRGRALTGSPHSRLISAPRGRRIVNLLFCRTSGGITPATATSVASITTPSPGRPRHDLYLKRRVAAMIKRGQGSCSRAVPTLAARVEDLCTLERSSGWGTALIQLQRNGGGDYVDEGDARASAEAAGAGATGHTENRGSAGPGRAAIWRGQRELRSRQC